MGAALLGERRRMMVKPRKGEAPKCRCQHVVPRFIVARFASDATSTLVWAKNIDDVLVSTGPGDAMFWEERLYSDELDYSWMGYESNSASVIGSLAAGASALRVIDYWWYLSTTIAGMVARDRMLTRELDASTWSFHCSAMSSDQERCLVLDCVLSALMVADIRVVRSSKPLLNNDRGYSWDSDHRRLLTPVGSYLALVASWDDPEPNGMPPRLIDLAEPTRRIGSISTIDVDDANFRCAWQADSVVFGCSREIVSHYAVLGDYAGFLGWLSEWFPSRACYSWAPVFDEIGRRRDAGWDHRRLAKSTDSVTLGYNADESGLDGLMLRLRSHHQKIWTPIWLNVPDRRDLLASCASMVGDDLVLVDYSKTDDWTAGPWQWVPVGATRPSTRRPNI